MKKVVLFTILVLVAGCGVLAPPDYNACERVLTKITKDINNPCRIFIEQNWFSGLPAMSAIIEGCDPNVK